MLLLRIQETSMKQGILLESIQHEMLKHEMSSKNTTSDFPKENASLCYNVIMCSLFTITVFY